MKTKIDLSSWKRKAHFDFFNQFADPTFEATSKVNVTKAYLNAKANNESFFLRYLHASMRAVNTIDEFKIRIEEEGIFQYDTIHAGPTIAREDGTFGFSYLPFFENFHEFAASAKPIIEKVKAARDLNPSSFRANVVHYSSVPWVNFTGIKHPVYSTEIKESVPKITFGKVTKKNSKFKMPVSVNANHALVDGRHIGMYLDKFQEFLDSDN